MYDHVGFNVADFARSRAFYLASLGTLGHRILAEGAGWAMFGNDHGGRLWIGALGAAATPIHLAFSATGPEAVQAFHRAALAAGGRDNGAPGPRPHYGPGYYAAFAYDPDGHNVEAVCHLPG